MIISTTRMRSDGDGRIATVGSVTTAEAAANAAPKDPTTCIASTIVIGLLAAGAGFGIWKLIQSDSPYIPIYMPPLHPSNLTVGVYYYPWHNDDFHRGAGYLREKLQPPQYPQLGEYDDQDPYVIAQHLAWSRYAGISLWTLSWWGPDSIEEETIQKSILNHPQLGDHKLALFYETSGRLKLKEATQTLENIQADIEHICANYVNHPNYYHIDGRPVLFVYLTRRLEAMGILEETVQLMRSTSCGSELYIVGDHAFGSPKPANSPGFVLLDAITTYDVYGAINSYPYAGNDALDDYLEKQLEWRARTTLQGGYIPCISPGFNDRGVRLGTNRQPLSRRITKDAEEGSLFLGALRRAMYLVDTDNLLMITSWNEWHEDSQIEPVMAAGETSGPETYTKGVQYEGYGELYLDLLRDFIGFKNSTTNTTAGTTNLTVTSGNATGGEKANEN